MVLTGDLVGMYGNILRFMVRYETTQTGGEQLLPNVAIVSQNNEKFLLP